MKILYVGSERSDAQAIAIALRGIDQAVTVSWISRLEHAVKWLDENRDLAALVVEAQTNGASWPSVVEHVRGPAFHPAVVAIVAEANGHPFEPLRPEPDDYIARNPSLFRDLPVVVTRAIARAREHQLSPQASSAVGKTHQHREVTPTPQQTRGQRDGSAPSAGKPSRLEALFVLERAARADLEQKLSHATAALLDAEQRHQAALSAATEQLTERQAQYEIGMARATATWDMVDEQLRAAALEVGRARQDQASAAADVDRLSRNVSDLTSQLAEAATTHRALEGRLADAQSAVDAANARTDQERLAAAEQSAERQREFEAQIAQEVDRRRSVEDLLAQALSARDDAERRHGAAAADVKRLTEAETDLNSRLANITASRNDLERRLAATEAAFDDASARATRERLASSKRAAEREAELDRQIREERERCATLEQAVRDADAALRDAEERHEVALSAAASDFAERQARFDRELSQTATDRDHLAQRLSDTEIALDTVRHDHQTATGEVERLTQRKADLISRLAHVQVVRDTLDLQLADAKNASAEAEIALRDAHKRHDAALSAAAADLAEHRAEFARALSQTVADRDHLTQRLSDAELALDNIRHDHQTAAADVERLTQREADLISQLADVQAARETLDLQLAEAKHAIVSADERAARERAAAAERQEHVDRELSRTVADRNHLAQQLRDAQITLDHVRHDHQTAAADVERLTQREADLTSQLVDIRAVRDTLDLQLAKAKHANVNADERAARERAAAAERQEHVDRELSQAVADRDHLTQRLSDSELALDNVRHEHQTAAADVERLTQREADLTSQLADVQAARDTLDLQLAEAKSAIVNADERAAREQAAAAERQERFEHELLQTVADRDHLTRRLSDAEIALYNVRHELTDATRAIEEGDERATRERAAAAEREGDLEARLAHETATRNALEQNLADARSAAFDAERSLRAEADALRTRGVEREAHFEVLLAQEQFEHESRLADMQQCARKLTLEREALHQSLTTVQEQSRRLQETLAATAKALEVATDRNKALQAEADQLPRVREQLDAIRAESNRLFEQAGLAMFRCTPDGALIHANRACTTLVGRRTLDQPPAHFAPAVFEAPDVLSWLIERSSTRAKESIETTWRRNDGGRLYVRLSARRLSPQDVIEVVAEDLTRVRVLQERLDQAHRMEAVGRYASEVAVTGGNLLSDIHENARQWLATAGGKVESRGQGELLINEVKRAADLLHQLAAFGDEQARTPMLVDLNTLIRDLQPVLKRVAGDHVDVQLRDLSSPLNVDVPTDRVERLLVNLASYGRERMPSGGRLRIDLGSIVVDRHFATRHPNVRLGLHALITVTGIRTAARAEGGLQAHAEISQRPRGRVETGLGVDFGTLQGLVSECGGHLWMRVQPAGDMVAKIRLPLSSVNDQARSRALATRGARERSTARWFQHTSS